MTNKLASIDEGAEKHQSFAALRHPGARAYLSGAMLAMMADSIEHVISYWIIFQKFESPALGGFAVFSHWVPFLLFSVYAGALADRFDPRRLIQVGMVLFMLVSFGWGVLFVTDSLEMWHAVVLLIIHGLAGVIWAPAAQLLVHDIVGPAQLQSAVRMIASGSVSIEASLFVNSVRLAPLRRPPWKERPRSLRSDPLSDDHPQAAAR